MRRNCCGALGAVRSFCCFGRPGQQDQTLWWAIPSRALKDFEISEDQLVARANAARVIAPSGNAVEMRIGDIGFVGMVDRETFDPYLRARAEQAGARFVRGKLAGMDTGQNGSLDLKVDGTDPAQSGNDRTPQCAHGNRCRWCQFRCQAVDVPREEEAALRFLPITRSWKARRFQTQTSSSATAVTLSMMAGFLQISTAGSSRMGDKHPSAAALRSRGITSGMPRPTCATVQG